MPLAVGVNGGAPSRSTFKEAPMIQIALNALVAHYLDMGRGHELAVLENILKKPLDRKERVLIMIIFARARVAHSAFFNKRLGRE
jgi:hypothetical protein